MLLPGKGTLATEESATAMSSPVESVGVTCTATTSALP
jgi:hypothetical protein